MGASHCRGDVRRPSLRGGVFGRVAVTCTREGGTLGACPWGTVVCLFWLGDFSAQVGPWAVHFVSRACACARAHQERAGGGVFGFVSLSPARGRGARQWTPWGSVVFCFVWAPFRLKSGLGPCNISRVLVGSHRFSLFLFPLASSSFPSSSSRCALRVSSVSF